MYRVMWTDAQGRAQAVVVEAGSKTEALALARHHPNGPGTLPARAVFVPGG
jgi:hypothetical protein